MVLFLKPLTPDKKVYLDQINDYLIIDAICKIDKKVEYDLYLIGDSINQFGLVNKTNILLDELFLVLTVNRVFYKDVDELELKKYTDYYGVNAYLL